MTWIVLDFETVSGCDLKKAGAWRYAEDPSTDVLCLSWELGTFRQTWYPGDAPPPFLSVTKDVLHVAHNAAFEKAIWRNIMVPVYGWPDIPNDRWHDTMARCANLVLPQALDRAGKVLGLAHEKDMEGNRLTLSLSRINKKTGMYPEITPVIRERVGRYCEGDVAEQSELHRRIGWLPAEERKVWILDQTINERGVRLDVPLIRAMKEIVDKASKPLAEEFREITGGLNMTQVAKVGSWLLDQGVALPDMQKDTLAAVLGETEEGEYVEDRIELELPPHVERALRIRQLIGSASIKKLDAMLACVCADGRARGLLNYHGAGTGRWAGRLLQPQNFPRGSIDKDITIEQKIDALMTGDPEWVYTVLGEQPVETVVSSLRHCLIAEDDHELCAGDFAGIEARMVLSIAGQWDKVKMMADGVDVYCDMATSIYKREITKADTEERQTGKNSVLGLGFQMGADRFHREYCEGRPVEFAQRVVDTYRKEWAPDVPQVWYALDDAAIRAVWDRRPQEAYGVLYALEDRWLTARLPSGRKLYYFNPQMVRKAMPWDETDVRRGWTYQAMKTGQWKTIHAFGGLMTENVVQALARDLMVDAMFKCEAENYPVVLTVHDEVVSETKRPDPKMLQQIMEDIPQWAKDLKVPVKAECWAGQRYRK